MSSNNNTKYGVSSLNSNSGSNNTAVGAYSAYSNLDASNNTAIGSNSSYYNTDGANNTALGAGSLCNNTIGSLNTAIGSSALEGLVQQSTGNQNVAVGAQALYSNAGSNNTSVGTYSLLNNVDGSNNTAIGFQSLYSNTGANNSAIGAYAALGVTGGSYNTFLGTDTSFDNLGNSYSYSTAIGYNALIDASNEIMMGGITPNGVYPNVVIPGSAQFTTYTPLSYTGLSIVPKDYVDAASQGLAPKGPVVAATTDFVNGIYSNTSPGYITGLTLPLTIDSVLILDGSSVLIKNQSTDASGSIANGIYYLDEANFQLVRRADLPVGSDAVGAFCFVEQGTQNGRSLWIQANRPAVEGGIVLVGTERLNFVSYYKFPFKIGRGLDFFPSPDSNTYLEVDLSLNFINYLDSTFTNPTNQPGGAPGGSGTLNIGNNTTQTIIGPTGTTRNSVILTSGITGPTGSFTNIIVSGPSILNGLVSAQSGITGATGSFTNIAVSGPSILNGLVSAPAGITGATGSFTYLTTSQDALINALTVGRGAGNGSTNTALGTNSLFNNDSTSSADTAIGFKSLEANTTGDSNTAVGYYSLNNNTTGSTNTGVGYFSLLDNTIGGSNVALGYRAGQDMSGNSSYNTFLGALADVDLSANTYNHSTAVGYGATINASNQIMLGGIGPNGVYPQVVAPGGITGATGSFTNIAVSGPSILNGLVSAPAGITGATGSFTYLTATSGITGATGSFSNIAVSGISKLNGLVSAPAGITGATGSFTNINVSGPSILNGLVSAPAGITGATGSFTNLYANNRLDVSGNATIISGINNTSSTSLGFGLGVITNAAPTAPGVINTSIAVLSQGYELGFAATRGNVLTSTSDNFFGIYQDAISNGNYNPITKAGDHILLTGQYGRITGQDASGGIVICPWSATSSGTRMDVSGNFTFYNQMSAPAGITGATGSFTYLSTSQGITGPTGSFTNIAVSGPSKLNGLVSAPAGITGATGSFAYLNVLGNTTDGFNTPYGLNVSPSNFFYDSNNPTSQSSFKIELGGANCLIYKGAGGNIGTATVIQNNGTGGGIGLASTTTALYVNQNASTPGVGIMTGSPNYTLDVSGSLQVSNTALLSNALLITDPNTSAYFDIATQLGSCYIESGTSKTLGSYAPICFTGIYNGGTASPWLYINPTSNNAASIGIGKIPNSSYALDVSGNINTNSNISITPLTADASNSFIYFNTSGTTTDWAKILWHSSADTDSYLQIGTYDNANTPGNEEPIYFTQENYGNTTTYVRMKINDTGVYINPTNAISPNPFASVSASSYQLNVNGAAYATAFNTPSDYRIKENIKILDESFTVDELNPVTFFNKKTEKQDMGLIAHELQEVYPFLVNGEKDGEEHQSVNYTSLIALLIKEIKELKQRVNTLEERM